MILKFEIEVEMPEPEDFAESVYNHIYLDDYDESEDIDIQILYRLYDVLENDSINISKQIPDKYRKKYIKTLNKLINDYKN